MAEGRRRRRRRRWSIPMRERRGRWERRGAEPALYGCCIRRTEYRGTGR
jgi:hypothetical protein